MPYDPIRDVDSSSFSPVYMPITPSTSNTTPLTTPSIRPLSSTSTGGATSHASISPSTMSTSPPSTSYFQLNRTLGSLDAGLVTPQSNGACRGPRGELVTTPGWGGIAYAPPDTSKRLSLSMLMSDVVSPSISLVMGAASIPSNASEPSPSDHPPWSAGSVGPSASVSSSNRTPNNYPPPPAFLPPTSPSKSPIVPTTSSYAPYHYPTPFSHSPPVSSLSPKVVQAPHGFSAQHSLMPPPSSAGSNGTPAFVMDHPRATIETEMEVEGARKRKSEGGALSSEPGSRTSLPRRKSSASSSTAGDQFQTSSALPSLSRPTSARDHVAFQSSSPSVPHSVKPRSTFSKDLHPLTSPSMAPHLPSSPLSFKRPSISTRGSSSSVITSLISSTTPSPSLPPRSATPTFTAPSSSSKKRRYDPIRSAPGTSILLPMKREEYEYARSNPGYASKSVLRGWVRPISEGEKADRARKSSTGDGSARDEVMSGGNEEVKSEDEQKRVASHYNYRPEIDQKNRQFSPIFGLKAFNNWIKSCLISKFSKEALPDRRRGGPGSQSRNTSSKGIVLDMGCGKGGDLMKWNLSGIEHYIGIDIAEVSVQQASARARDLRYRSFDFEFYAMDCFSREISDVLPSGRLTANFFDLVSIQFCMHYAFDREERVRMMLKNVSSYLKVGGIFFGTIPNAEKLIEQLQSIPKDSDQLSFGNSVYSIEFQDRDSFPTYGHRYSFFLQDAVEDVPEYLVHFDNFRELASEYKLDLVYKKEFSEVFEEEKDIPEFKQLLERIKVVDSKGEFKMTEDQWEVANLYLAFAFQKR